jgi:hypothetical protein
MSTDALPTSLQSNLQDSFQRFQQRALRLNVMQAVIGGILIGCAWLVGSMWADLIVELPVSVRWWLGRIAVLVPFAIGIALFVRARRDKNVLCIAKQIDRTENSHGAIEGSLQLAFKPRASAVRQIESGLDLRGALSAFAIERSTELVRNAKPAEVLSDARVRKGMWILFSSFGLLSLIGLVAPRLAWTQTARLFFPSSNIPLYSSISIELEPEEIEVLFGNDCPLAARVVGGERESLQLVLTNADGVQETIPMLAEGEQRFGTVLNRMRAPMEFYARAGTIKSRIGRIKIQYTPEILKATAVLQFPTYTRKIDQELPIDDEGWKGLKGTQVQLTLTSNRHLRRGVLSVMHRDGSRTEHVLLPEKSVEEPTSVRGTYILDEPGQFEVKLEDIDGRMSVDDRHGPIVISADQPPSVRIAQPRPISLATPDAALPIAVVAEDDFGIDRLELFRSLNGSRANPLLLTTGNEPRVQAELKLPLELYGLSPGDEIQLFARAEDNCPDGPQSFESPITTIRIISREEFQERLVQQQGLDEALNRYRQIQRQLENAAEALRKAEEAQQTLDSLDASDEDRNKAKETLEQAAQKAHEAAAQIARIADQPLPIDLDRKLSESMKQVASQLREQADELDDLADASLKQQGKLSDEQREQLKQIAEKLAQERKDVKENVTAPLEQMQKTLPLMMAQQRFENLATQQRDLANRMQSLVDTNDPNDPVQQRRMRNLESQQQALREDLSDIMEQLEQGIEGLPADPELEQLRQTASDFLQKLRNSEAPQSMSDAQSSLLNQQAKNATDAATEAAEILETMLTQAGEMNKKACENCKAKFAPQANAQTVQDALDQLLNMMSGKKPGKGAKGQSSGFGAGASGRGGMGGSERSMGQSNQGLYGSIPTGSPSSGKGKGEHGGPTRALDLNATDAPGGNSSAGISIRQSATGDAANSIPSQYRRNVSEYFKRLTEESPK